MRKSPLLPLALLLSFATMAQPSFDTAATKRAAILEVFTGVQSVNCPAGDRTADAICNSHAGRAWYVDIHTGAYATLYATPEGDSIAAVANPYGYPTASVNRHRFNGNSTAIDRGEWSSAVANILSQNSPIGMTASAEINSASRLLTVNVQMHLTPPAFDEELFLTVMLLQNNVIGPQNGGEAYPARMVGTQYRHNHVLRCLLTPVGGDHIGSYHGGIASQRTYSLTIPQTIGDIPIDDNFGDLEVLAFVSQGNGETVTGTRALMVGDRPAITAIAVDHPDCSRNFSPYVTVTNLTRDNIGALVLLCDGDTIVANKEIASLASDTVHLPPYHIDPNGSAIQHCTQSRTARLLRYTDRTDGSTRSVDADPVGITFADFDIFTVRGPVRLTVDLDSYPSETSLTITQLSNCHSLLSTSFGRPLADHSVTYILDPASAGLYVLDLHDNSADGMCHADRGMHALDADGNEFLTILGDYGYDAVAWLNIQNGGSGQCLGIDPLHQSNTNIRVYPNPVSGRLAVDADTPVLELTVFDPAGRRVATATSGSIDLSHLPAGLYLLRAVTLGGTANSKIVKR